MQPPGPFIGPLHILYPALRHWGPRRRQGIFLPPGPLVGHLWFFAPLCSVGATRQQGLYSHMACFLVNLCPPPPPPL